MVSWLKILCAVDFSASARDALEQAAELARRFDAELTLVHVHDGRPVSRARVAKDAPSLEAEARELGGKLGAWKHEAERLSGRPVRTLLASGSPAAEIVRAAAHDRADLVVTGTYARRGVARLLLGSVAEQVVREAPCAVLVARVPPERGD